MNSLNKHLLLEEGGWTRISCSKMSNWKHCLTKKVAGECFVNKSSCKTKPPTPPKPKPKEDPKPEPPKPSPEEQTAQDFGVTPQPNPQAEVQTTNDNIDNY